MSDSELFKLLLLLLFAFVNLRCKNKEGMTESTRYVSKNICNILSCMLRWVELRAWISVWLREFSLYQFGCKKEDSFSSCLNLTYCTYWWLLLFTARPVHSGRALVLILLAHFAWATAVELYQRKRNTLKSFEFQCVRTLCTSITPQRSACLISR